MILTRNEKRAVLFLTVSFLCGLALLGWRSFMSDDVLLRPEGTAEEVETTPQVINLNRAGLQELMSLPGIGEKYARRIIELRRRKGGFSRPEELLEVEGIGERRLEKIRRMICLE